MWDDTEAAFKILHLLIVQKLSAPCLASGGPLEQHHPQSILGDNSAGACGNVHELFPFLTISPKQFQYIKTVMYVTHFTISHLGILWQIFC